MHPYAFHSSLGMIYCGISLVILLHLFRARNSTPRALILSSLTVLAALSFPVLKDPYGFASFLLFSVKWFMGLILPLASVGAGIAGAYALCRKLRGQSYRALFHMLGGILILLFLAIDEAVALLAVSFAISLFIIAEYVRTCEDENELTNFVRMVFSPALRKDEEKRYLASFFFLLGALILIYFAPKSVCIASISMLTFGDPAASIAGGKYGTMRIPYNRAKSVQGSLSMFLVCILITFLLGLGISGIIASAAAAMAESIPSRMDNLLIPLASGISLSLI